MRSTRRRVGARRDDDRVVSQASSTADQGPALLALYDTALPEVYGYLVRRCDGAAVAEDLTAETFLAAVAAVQKGTVPTMTTAWLIGVARHKLVDHWRQAGARRAQPAGGGRRAAARRRPVGRPPRRRRRPRGARPARRPPPRPRSRCATSTACPSPRSPTTSAAPSTPPRRCSCAPAWRSAGPTKGATVADPLDALRQPEVAGGPEPGLRRASCAAAWPTCSTRPRQEAP